MAFSKQTQIPSSHFHHWSLATGSLLLPASGWVMFHTSTVLFSIWLMPLLLALLFGTREQLSDYIQRRKLRKHGFDLPARTEPPVPGTDRVDMVYHMLKIVWACNILGLMTLLSATVFHPGYP